MTLNIYRFPCDDKRLTGSLPVWLIVSILTLLCLLYFSGSESSETQEDVYVASVETDRGVKEQLRLYDTKGLHDGQDLPKHYYSVADGFVLVYSVDSLESFKKVDTLKKEIDKSRDKKEVWLGALTTIHKDIVCTVLSTVQRISHSVPFQH